ncbi:MAG TPA: STAS domain-containing protein [Mycobacteriales bacterium]|nr:STAS domain-containing protein [Mycobacteriales bacterium]
MQRSSAAQVMSVETADGVRVHVRGELDDAATGRLRGLLDDVVAPRSVVRVDLSRADGLPVAVLRALAATHRRLSEGGGGLVVEGPSPAARRVLRTSGLHRVLPVSTRAGRRRAPAPADERTA